MNQARQQGVAKKCVRRYQGRILFAGDAIKRLGSGRAGCAWCSLGMPHDASTSNSPEKNTVANARGRRGFVEDLTKGSIQVVLDDLPIVSNQLRSQPGRCNSLSPKDSIARGDSSGQGRRQASILPAQLCFPIYLIVGLSVMQVVNCDHSLQAHKVVSRKDVAGMLASSSNDQETAIARPPSRAQLSTHDPCSCVAARCVCSGISLSGVCVSSLRSLRPPASWPNR